MPTVRSIVSQMVGVLAFMLAVLLIGVLIDQAHAEGKTYAPSDRPLLECRMTLRRAPTDAQSEAGHPGAAFPLSEFDLHQVFLTRNLTEVKPEDALEMKHHNCFQPLDLTGLGEGQWYVLARTRDSEGRFSAFSDPLPFMVASTVMPPAPPILVWGTQPVTGVTALYGPVDQPTLYAPSPALIRTQHLEVRATLNTLGTRQGLVSRDANGQDDPGHTSLWVGETGELVLRLQGLEGTQTIREVLGVVQSGLEFKVDIALGGEELVVWVDNVEVARVATQRTWLGNNLPLTLGALCGSCDEAGAGRAHPIDGVVQMRTWAEPRVPVNVGGGV